MIILLSPAKTLDFDSKPITQEFSRPEYVDHSEKLIKKLRSLSKPKLMKIMSISKDLAQLNYDRYAEWQPEFTADNSRQSVLAFKGDVYQGLEIETFSEEDLAYTQDHLRILSGLYGLLKPLDLIQPYRLEMGTNLKVGRKSNLYEFWDDQLTKDLNASLDSQHNRILVNLASHEYAKAVDLGALDVQVVEPTFQDWKNGKYKPITYYLKRARGWMAAWILKHRVETYEDLKHFERDGYAYDPELSEENSQMVFSRKQED